MHDDEQEIDRRCITFQKGIFADTITKLFSNFKEQRS
jgi:hypothetical protein